MNIFITGGAGYIGSHTCKALHDQGLVPITFDNLSTGHREFVKWGPLVVGDLRNPDDILRALALYPCEAVIHFAASSLVSESMTNAQKYFENNVGGSINLISACQKKELNKIVFSSTCAIYGHPQTKILSENHPKNPINTYGVTKLMIEQILEWNHKIQNLQSVSLRYFNASGANPTAGIGERHEPESHLIPLVIDAALNIKKSITIFGSDYDTPDGTAIRDYIHVDDLASAHILACKKLIAKESLPLAMNLGTGTGYSVKQVIDSTKKITQCNLNIKQGDRRAGDPDQLVADTQLSQKYLGWTPQYSRLDYILKTAWQWHQQ